MWNLFKTATVTSRKPLLMGISSYSVSLTLKSPKEFSEIGDFKMFENILTLQECDECYFHISNELGYLLHSENRFNKKFEGQYGKINYSDILKPASLSKMKTLQDAKPWLESTELTVIGSTEEDFDILDPTTLLMFLLALKSYLDSFKWYSDKPKLVMR